MEFRVAKARLAPALFAGLFAGPASAGWEAGVGLDLSSGLVDDASALPSSDMGMGVMLRAPTRLRLGEKLAIRGDVGLGLTNGHDRVEWLAYDGLVPVYSEDHATRLTTVGLLLGPELSPLSDASASPYFGTAVGMIWARHGHRFEGREAKLLGLETDGSGIHPYTTQIAPAFDLHGGARFRLPGRLAMEVEAGYNVAFMREARLSQAPAALEAVRTAYGLNQLRIGLNLVIPLARGSE